MKQRTAAGFVSTWVALLCVGVVCAPGWAQTDGDRVSRPVVAPLAPVYVIRVPFYAAAKRADIVQYNEYRYLATGLAAENPSIFGIKRSDFDKAVRKRYPQADTLLTSGRVSVLEAQRVRVIWMVPTDFHPFEKFDHKDIPNYIARAETLMPLRLIEILEGPRKGQQFWTTASIWREEVGSVRIE